jgi:Zn-dependent protease with chaperone function
MGTIVDIRKEVARGSTRRFLTLLCLLLVSGVYMFYVMALTLRPGSFDECAREAGFGLDNLRSGASLAGSDAFESCRAQAANGAAVVAVAGTAVVLASAVLVYWWLPAWRWRRLVPVERVAEPVSAEGTEPLRAHVTRLAREAGLTRMPAFAVDPRALTAGAVAFGRAGRYTVCLHAGLVARRVTDPKTFDAVLRHELAHVQSRDVDVAYLVVALWRVVSLPVLVPFVLLQSWLLTRDVITGADRVDWVQATPSLGKLAFGAFLVAQVYLARNELLRSRELCADLDAVGTGADPQVWNPRSRGVPVNAAGEVAPQPRWFASLWHSHPAWQRRYALLVGKYSISTGASGLQAVLAFGTIFGVIVAIDGMPPWLRVTLVYLVGPIVVTTLIVSTPQKRPGFIWISEQVAEYRRRIVRPFVPLAVFTVSFTALAFYDPLGGIRGDGMLSYAAPTMPHPYDLDRPTIVSPSGAEIVAWLDDGGRDTVVELRRSFDVDMEGLIGAVPDPSELAAHCTQVGDALVAGRERPPLPHQVGQSAWELMLTHAEAGTDLVCSPDHPGVPAGPGRRHAELHYESVLGAYDTLVVLLDPYPGAALPPE